MNYTKSMIDTNHYTIIYDNSQRSLMYLREGGSYSFLCEDRGPDDHDVRAYQEIIVPANDLEEAIDIPSSEVSSIKEKMTLLFGNCDGFENFVSFCDQNKIETMTLFWD